MTAKFNPDPIGEYQRICPYCSEIFTANHMNRKYCPSKDGIVEYCKRRSKRLHRNKEAERLFNRLLECNNKILYLCLGESHVFYVKESKLLQLGYRFDIFLAKSPVSRDDFYSVFIINFCVERVRQDRSGALYKIRYLGK